jgi:hypothetical protein
MGHRTLSVSLVLRALFLDPNAYNSLRDDDNPFVEGVFLIVLLGVVTALLSLIGEIVAWASTPSINAIKDVVLQAYQRTSWWSQIAANPSAVDAFNQSWNLGWRIFPPLFGAPSPVGAAFNILAWPLLGLLSWLLYGALAFVFARLFHGTGTLNQTLGTTALAATPLLLRGLHFIPFLVIGGVISTWQLICRYRAIRSVHGLPWQWAFWATVLPFAVYLLFWLVVALGVVAVGAVLGGR